MRLRIRIAAVIALLLGVFAASAPIASALPTVGLERRTWLCPYIQTEPGKRTVLFCLPLL